MKQNEEGDTIKTLKEEMIITIRVLMTKFEVTLPFLLKEIK